MSQAVPTVDEPTMPDTLGARYAPDAAARLRVLAMSAMTVLTAVLMGLYLLEALEWRATPFLGVTVDHTLSVSAARPTGDTPWSGRVAGLRPGDRLRSLDGVPVAGEGAQQFDTTLETYRIGDTVTVDFLRPVRAERDAAPIYASESCGPVVDGLASCSVAVVLEQMPGSDTLAFFLIPYVSGLLVWVMAIVLLRLRPYQPVTLLAVATILLLTIYMGGIFDAGTSHRLIPVWLMSVGLLFGLMITIGILFPIPIGLAYRFPWLRWLPIAAGVGLSLLLIAQYLSETQDGPRIASQLAGLVIVTGNAILASLLFFYQRSRAVDSITRDQANTLLLGMMLALAPAVVWLIGLVARLFTDVPVLAFSVEASMPFLIFPAVGLAYAVLRLAPFDSDRFISRGITYSIMLVALVLGYFFMVLGASLFAGDIIDASDPILMAAVIFAIAVLLLPVRNRIQDRIDRIYFKQRRDFQSRLEEFTQSLTTFTGQEDTIRAFRQILEHTIQPVNIFVFLRDPDTGDYIVHQSSGDSTTDIQFGADSGVVELVQAHRATIYLDPRADWPAELRVDRARLTILKTLVIAGLGGEETDDGYQTNGFALIGPPRSNDGIYRYEELRFIDNLIAQVAVAVERAQVIGRLERRVAELDVLSQVGQAVNFTIEYDDLLELINAQTSKLIHAEYFYITLYDPNSQQLYYAFFLESVERDREKENRRWPLGKDFYSEIVREGNPLRIDDYADAMRRKGYRYVFESELTQSWMGVPLIAGQTTLGVLAAGDPSPDRSFTADELRIFVNLAALAATSLDKARLFTETNVRARQLSVLNDISRSLVAAESDVDALLDLITTSAVDILNAEAGSLLLSAEDGSGDLEFKSVIGGMGEELLGKRLEAGYGLVGKVAHTGEPAISNNTAEDKRWQGEVSNEEGFKTSSILAVPLIAKSDTIGVLEVLNKRDGTVYTEQDVSLLTAFAGQAAIALENARLFQRTDEQLARRLEELEALERIDVELNRTLDLNRISELTVTWALENSNATAGVLGLVNEQAGDLHIVYSTGYPPPPGADEDSETENPWSLDRGIIKRVMRTRQLDLAPDVSIDPDHVEVLPGSLSQLTIPMRTADEIIAVLVLETNTEPRLSLLDVARVQRMADHAVIAIANALFSADLMRASESKSEFVGFAAHELKNPLTSVKGYAAMLQNPKTIELAGPEQVKTMAEIIVSNADRMQGIIDDLRDIAAIDAGPAKFNIALEPTSFRNVVVDTLMSFQSQFEEREQNVVNRVAEDLPLVMADSKRLVQVMTNFVSNAHKYGGYGTDITIDAKVIERYRNQRGEVIGDVLHISVADQGIGMSKEDLKRLFHEDYFRSENEKAREQKGTGLGMMITKRIIERHNGEVWVESVLEQGTTFHFVIPLANRISAASTQETRAAEPASD